MHRSALIEVLRERFPSLPPKTVAAMTNAVFDAIIDTVARGGRAEIRRFGTFYSRSLGRRMLRNPRSGEALEVPAKCVPRFKPAAQLRKMVGDKRKTDAGD